MNAKLVEMLLSEVPVRRYRYHNSLTPEQTKQLRSIYTDFGQLVDPTFEQFEREFLFEKNVDAEIRLWTQMAKAFRECLRRYRRLRPDDVATAVIAISLGICLLPPGVPMKAIRFLRKHVPFKPLEVRQSI
ncbi:hypothetical protein [Lignipirellula cremea]|uniref:Uncharacterized protein n=1 Tax=Lignipirellula cremea TaxID=2528010 RepID=A0A518DQN6_9BACT|nr:hypothetical protein [Lignipirellula cremea]QDU94134.1 hypothetical protein Pla8534_19200 [Lignipirellula cremea]